MYRHNKRRKATSVSTFEFSTLYTKLPQYKLPMKLNSLIENKVNILQLTAMWPVGLKISKIM